MHNEKEKIMQLSKNLPLKLHWIDVEERLEENQLVDIIHQYDGIICGDDRITPKVIDRAKKLKTIVKWGTGIDSIDKPYAEKKGIKVRNTLNAFTEPVSETTIGMILAFTRSLFTNDLVFKTKGWSKPQGHTLAEKTVGIIGFGNIGKAVAKKLLPFNTQILVNDIREINESEAEDFNVKISTKEEIYEKSDIITFHCDLNPSSYHLLNSETISLMEKKPYIINTARGPIIDEKALIRGLETNMISGAGLDVFEYEPVPLDNKLREMPNVIASCHNSNSSPLRWEFVHKNSLNMLIEELENGK